jgi:hypothetical protein
MRKILLIPTTVFAAATLASVIANLEVQADFPDEWTESTSRGEPRASRDERGAVAAMAMPAACDPVAPANWLDPIPKRFQLCSAQGVDHATVPCSPTSRADVNGDGREEYLSGYPSVTVVANGGQPVDIGSQTLRLSEVIDGGSGKLVRLRSVFPVGTAVGIGVVQVIPDIQSATVHLLGWRDMDADGDLDLLCYIAVSQGGFCCQETNFYFENIGYEKPAPPLAADLNQDGYVNGLDLGLLLGQWGPNS